MVTSSGQILHYTLLKGAIEPGLDLDDMRDFDRFEVCVLCDRFKVHVFNVYIPNAYTQFPSRGFPVCYLIY